MAVSKISWKYLDEISKKRLARDPYLTMIIGNGNEDIARYLAIDRLVEYIGRVERSAKIHIVSWKSLL